VRRIPKVKWVLFIILSVFFIGWLLAATNVTVQGGPVKVKGGYVDLGTTVIVSTTPSPSENAGQCIGILCGVTYN
jgi:hypothetical protein